MTHGIERCPQCDRALTPRTNGIGVAYLECWCGYVEGVRRRLDPFPTHVTVRKSNCNKKYRDRRKVELRDAAQNIEQRRKAWSAAGGRLARQREAQARRVAALRAYWATRGAA